MNKFVRNLLTEWRKLKLPVSGETMIVAVSGGADSVSLIVALSEMVAKKKINHKLIVAHFNHNLRGKESAADEDFTKRLAEVLGLDFQSQKGKISLIGNLEQNARIARYDFLAKLAQENNAVAVLTGHTKNDQAETLLLNLIRGSGVEGLAAMNPIRTLSGQISLVRPLLRWAEREETVEFCREHHIDFCRDAMNDDSNYARVRIRKEIIPLLQIINPKIIDTLVNTSETLREILSETANDPIVIADDLSQADLIAMSKYMRIQTLRRWLALKSGSLRGFTSAHLNAIDDLLFSRKSGRISELPNGNRVVKKAGKLLFEKTGVEKCSTGN